MQRMYENSWIMAALVCICPWLSSCVENDTDDTIVIDTQELCTILSPETIAEMGLDCDYQVLCDVGKRKCDGLNILECQIVNHATDWIVIDTCTDSCRDGECVTPMKPEPVCSVGDIDCSGSNRIECKDDHGTAVWSVIEACAKSCENGQCINECPSQCTQGNYACDGKTLTKCEMDNNGCYVWKAQKTCTQYCYADTGKCAEELPTCKLTNNSSARIIEWVDGDTLWVRPENDGLCNNYEYDSSTGKWMSVRFNIRIHGIDAPECAKQYNGRYMTCVKDTNYNDHNERYGYESWQTAVSLLPADAEVMITCDKPESDGTCPKDATGHRELAYLGYVNNNTSYDYSTEMARLGMAFSNTKFTSSKRRQICMAQKEAQSSHVGIWSTGGLSQMGSGKRNGLKNMDKLCQKATQ